MRSTPCLLALLLTATALHSQEKAPIAPSAWEPLFLGYGIDPEMDFGGRTVMSLQSVLSRAFASIADVGERHPGLSPAWEFPVAANVLLLQHEIGGHGGRGRELGLGPSYAFSFDLSAATSTKRPPKSNEENALIAAGGTEADNVLAHRGLMDLLRLEGGDGARVPLLFMTKLDLTAYVFTAKNPDRGQDFVDQYLDGNDIVYYFLSRQAARRGSNPASIWDGSYRANLNDPLLGDNYDDARVTAIWNLLDPSLAGAVVNYFRQHVLGGSVRVHAPVLRLGNGVGLTLGTRGALGPQEVSRFLDLYAATRHGVFTVYVRDLDSSVDRAYGFGAGLHGLHLCRHLELDLAADAWDEPESREGIRTGNGWNASAGIDALFGERWGLAAKLGAKSDGFFPGLPVEDGVYLALGARGVW